MTAMHALVCALASRRKDGADLDRMVSVIVDHRHAIELADLGEAPLHAFEAGEAFPDLVVGQSELERDADGRQRVLHIMPAGHRHGDVLDRPPRTVALKHDRIEDAPLRTACRIVGPQVGKRREAVGYNAAVADLADDPLAPRDDQRRAPRDRRKAHSR
jgi:hypothetical protein